MPGHLLRTVPYGGKRILEVVVFDLLAETTDGIVNPANGGLSHGGGLAAQISEAAGESLDQECREYVQAHGRLEVGSALLTGAGSLPFKGVIHAVGPRFGSGDEERMIGRALMASFRIATEQGWKSLSFPALSSGIFSVPPEICVRAYFQAARAYFNNVEYKECVHTLRLVLQKGKIADQAAAFRLDSSF